MLRQISKQGGLLLKQNLSISSSRCFASKGGDIVLDTLKDSHASLLNLTKKVGNVDIPLDQTEVQAKGWLNNFSKSLNKAKKAVGIPSYEEKLDVSLDIAKRNSDGSVRNMLGSLGFDIREVDGSKSNVSDQLNEIIDKIEAKTGEVLTFDSKGMKEFATALTKLAGKGAAKNSEAEGVFQSSIFFNNVKDNVQADWDNYQRDQIIVGGKNLSDAQKEVILGQMNLPGSPSLADVEASIDFKAEAAKLLAEADSRNGDLYNVEGSDEASEAQLKAAAANYVKELAGEKLDMDVAVESIEKNLKEGDK